MKELGSAFQRTLAAIVALGIVTAAHYAGQTARWTFPQALLPPYGVSLVVLALSGHLILRRAARRSYQRYGRLTTFAFFLLCTNWGVFFAFPSLYGPYNWAWSWSNEVFVPDVVRFLGSVLIVVGLVGIVASMMWLGFARSTGQSLDLLRDDGPYRCTRNPQLVAGASVVLGYTILRPSWFAVGWLVLYALLTHLMVRSEEEHLRNSFGEEYQNYCARTPRYVSFLRKSRFT